MLNEALLLRPTVLRQMKTRVDLKYAAWNHRNAKDDVQSNPPVVNSYIFMLTCRYPDSNLRGKG